MCANNIDINLEEDLRTVIQIIGSAHNQRRGKGKGKGKAVRAKTFEDALGLGYTRVIKETIRRGLVECVDDGYMTAKNVVKAPKHVVATIVNPVAKAKAVAKAVRSGHRTDQTWTKTWNLTKEGKKLYRKRLRTLEELQALAERVKKPGDVMRPIKGDNGLCLMVPYCTTEGNPYPRLSMSNDEVKAILNRVEKKAKYIDVSRCFMTSLFSALGDLSSERQVKTFKGIRLLNDPDKKKGASSSGCSSKLTRFKELVKERSLTMKDELNSALMGSIQCKDPVVMMVRLVCLRLRKLLFGSSNAKRDFYFLLARKIIPHFTRILSDMGVLIVPRLDGAFVDADVDVDEVTRRLRLATGIPDVCVKVKEI